MLGCVVAVFGCGADAGEGDDAVGSTVSVESVESPAETVAVEGVAEEVVADGGSGERAPPEPAAGVVDDEALASAEALPVVLDADNHCERFRLNLERGRPRYQRIRRRWTEHDRRRFTALVRLVATEMGAEPRLFRAWALRESSYRPHALHVLDPDIEAATAAYRRLRYSAAEEAELLQVLASASARDPAYWEAKARLHRVQTFRDNEYLDAMVPLQVLAPDGTASWGSEHAWAFGYGAFGFNPAYYVPVWDARAPPWVFCQDDGLVAIITAVWVARAAKRECESQGLPGTYAMVDRRFSRGHCGPVGPDARFRQRIERLGLDPDAPARLGTRWARAQSGRGEILEFMRRRAVEEGLLPPRGPGA